jgi:hypothetical protein
MYAGSHRFKQFRKEENIVVIKQNEAFKGNAKWVYIVQRWAYSGLICNYRVVTCQSRPLNRICAWCQIWEHQTFQESGSEVCLIFIPEGGNTQLYSSGQCGIYVPHIRMWYIHVISLRQSFYPWMSRNQLSRNSLRWVENWTANHLCDWLSIIENFWFSEDPEFVRNNIV